MKTEELRAPKLFEKCEAVYKLLRAEAVPSEENPNVAVWTGQMTNFMRDNGYPPPLYTHILTALKNMGCIEKVRGGSRYNLGEWLVHLHNPPDPMIFAWKRDTNRLDGRGVHESTKWAIIDQRLRDTANSLVDLERRIAKLEHERT